jgi:hypothetical protein
MGGRRAKGPKGSARKSPTQGEPFPIEDSGFRGLIQPPDPGQVGLFAEDYSWSLFDPQDEILLSGRH